LANDPFREKLVLDKITIILVNPSHPGNIGAVARAMKNMGLTHLSLVSPKLFPHHDATARAAGADKILADAKIYEELSAALKNCHHVYALSARTRKLPWPCCNPEESAKQIIVHTQSNIEVGIVFGRENSGLTNAELALCQYHVTIPTHPDFPSLNLAAAVQIMGYELWRQVSTKKNSKPLNDLGHDNHPLTELNSDDSLATQDQMQGFFLHLQQTLLELKVLNPKHPKMLMQRLRRLFNRALLSEIEINILRGILTAINKKL
jgi:tRNA (cytidine32/uridine32-2'-O)-methyltransferase